MVVGGYVVVVVGGLVVVVVGGGVVVVVVVACMNIEGSYGGGVWEGSLVGGGGGLWKGKGLLPSADPGGPYLT